MGVVWFDNSEAQFFWTENNKNGDEQMVHPITCHGFFFKVPTLFQ